MCMLIIIIITTILCFQILLACFCLCCTWRGLCFSFQCMSRSSHSDYQVGRLMTSSLTQPYHHVPSRPSPEALPQLSTIPMGLFARHWRATVGGYGIYGWQALENMSEWDRWGEDDGMVKKKNRKVDKDLGYKWNRAGEKRGKNIAGGREKRERLMQGKIKFSLFFPSCFWRAGWCFFFPFPSFFWHRQSRLDHPSETTWCVALPSYPLFLPYMHSVTISVPGCVPGHLGNPTLLECERKYFAHFYYLFICCWRCDF